jgi:NAD-dependent deacetylase
MEVQMSSKLLNNWWRRFRSKASLENYEYLVDLVLTSQHTVVLTGAGISTRSGIPDFRSPAGGLWIDIDPLTVASIWGFREEPQRFYRWLRPLAHKMMAALPNPAHQALATMEKVGLVDLVITQNIDNLHQRAGSQHVLHVHGSADGAVCISCHHRETSPYFWETFWQTKDLETLPTCFRCNGVLKPDVVLFGEELPTDTLMQAQQAALNCDLMLIIGTSLEVMPAADLPLLARRRGARLAVLNLEPTMVDHQADVVLKEDLSFSLPLLLQACLESRNRS